MTLRLNLKVKTNATIFFWPRELCASSGGEFEKAHSVYIDVILFVDDTKVGVERGGSDTVNNVGLENNWTFHGLSN